MTLRSIVVSAISALAFAGFASHAASASRPERVVARASAATPVDFIVHLPLRNRAELEQLTAQQADPRSPLYRRFLTPAQFAAAFGPSARSVASALAFLRVSGFALTSMGSQVLQVRGTAAGVERAFGVHMVVARDARGRLSVVSSENAIRLPAQLAALGADVVGVTQTPQRHSMARFTQNRYSTLGGYWFDDLKQAYDYPSYGFANGSGVRVATFGVSDFSNADAAQYFANELLGGAGSLDPEPRLEHLRLAGYTPFDPNNGDSFESNLDIQMAAGSAPGATIIGISQLNSDAAFISGYQLVVDRQIADIVSTSYGECELFYTAAYNDGVDYTSILRDYDDVYAQGNAEGITFLESSGDNAGLDCPQPGYLNSPPPNAPPGQYLDVPGVETNADDPHVTAVGGTNLVTTYRSGSLKSAYVAENALHDFYGTDDPYGTGNVVTNELWGSGGGMSVLWRQPAYQVLDRPLARGRLMPDVSMHMGGCPFGAEMCNPNDSYDIEVLGGQLVGAIGTSASSPEFAGLLAVQESIFGRRVGNENVALAVAGALLGTRLFHQGFPADNGLVKVKAGQTGWNEVVGPGTPETRAFVFAPFAPAAGNPQSPSNP